MIGDTAGDRVRLWLAGRLPALAPRLRATVEDRRVERAMRRWDRASTALRDRGSR